MESQVVKDWTAQARYSEAASLLIEVLTARYGELPADLATTIKAGSDLAALHRWVPIAARCLSLEQFRQTVGV